MGAHWYLYPADNGEFGHEPQCPCSCLIPHLTSYIHISPISYPASPPILCSCPGPHPSSPYCVLCPHQAHPSSIPHPEPHAPCPIPYPTCQLPLLPACHIPTLFLIAFTALCLALVVSLCNHLINDNIHLCKVSENCSKVYKDVLKHDLSRTKLRINWYNVEQKDQKGLKSC